ncbi:hypothetical protein CERZMDRAFT_68660 [Cercospora zeae-maydis SCOH1-5]|uniref:FAS1 domain-containing protein n=1 Tax=Cercospora zeae-maydis SCOH1-5 TaxID=717836 RepID=A0A6A6FDM0_9PEZI|nr:hypothetical protein CERZMDRAFT_68660 [Cercospora zeae-maydis SCOH1-5]
MHFPALATASCLLSGVAAKSLDQVLSQHDDFSLLRELLHQHNLVDELESAATATIFAMTNKALYSLADFGINLTTADPNIARAIFKYAQLGEIYTTESFEALHHEAKVVHTALQPPLFNNVTRGQAAKLRSNRTGDRTEILLETGLGVLTPVVEADIPYDHGIIHAIDANMVLPHNISETARLGGMTDFLNLLERSDSIPKLESLSDVTIFIPQDEALAKLQPILDMLTPEQLKFVVAQHVVPNRVLYQSLFDGVETMETLDGKTLHIRRGSRGQIFVNDAEVVRTDMLLYGGVAHLINGALLPEKDAASCTAGSFAVSSSQAWTVLANHQLKLLAVLVLALLFMSYRIRQSRRQGRQLIRLSDGLGNYEKV